MSISKGVIFNPSKKSHYTVPSSRFIKDLSLSLIGDNIGYISAESRSLVLAMCRREMDLSTVLNLNSDDWNEFNSWVTPNNLLRFDIELT